MGQQLPGWRTCVGEDTDCTSDNDCPSNTLEEYAKQFEGSRPSSLGNKKSYGYTVTGSELCKDDLF